MSPRILIVGAGVAGLALARALQEHDFQVDAVERATEWRTAGLAFYLPANAVRALRALGAGRALEERAHPVRTQTFYNDRGRRMVKANHAPLHAAP